MAICTGCSLLCEDIVATFENGALLHEKNLCRKGHGHFQAAFTERTLPMIDGEQVTLDRAIAKAAEILKSAKSPLLYGWSNSTLEAQAAGIKLAEKMGATIDDTSSFCQGILMERILSGKIPTCTLDDVRNYADTSIFWGSDPSSSHPRHLSRFSYYPRGEKRQKSYEEERTCIVVDVRKSATARLCSNYYFRVAPGGDAQFIEAILAVLDGKIPKVGDKKKMIELSSVLKKTEWGAIFPGLGMIYSLQDNMELFERLLAKLNEVTTFKVIPMVGHYNMRGFNEQMREKTGFINRVSFQSGAPAHGPEHSVIAAAKRCDAALVIGSDPLSALPFATARALARQPLIAIDPRRSLTTDAAKVVIPSALYGLEAGGTAVRMDGVKIKFEPIMKSELLSDEQILTRIMEAI
ncbi:MAG: formylmethanofuran dehydrogenase subunit [Euryarchaeota archaeon]|nr:formylmethanofuran dehydrogenase subunit [Euryarchaeota archaeon]